MIKLTIYRVQTMYLRKTGQGLQLDSHENMSSLGHKMLDGKKYQKS